MSENGRYRQCLPIAVKANAQLDFRTGVQFADDRIQPGGLLIGVIGLAEKGAHIAMRMQVTKDAGIINRPAANHHDTDRRRLLRRFLHLHSQSMMVELVEDFIKPVIGLSPNRPTGIGQNGM